MDFEVVRTMHDGPPAEIEFPEGAGETFAAGQAVVLGNDGYLREAKAADEIITGIASAPASATATDGLVDCPVLVGNQTVFRAITLNVLAQLNLGDYADLDVDAGTGVHTVDNAAASGGATDNIFRIVKLVGTIGSVGIVHVLILHGLVNVHTEDDPPAA